MDDWNDGRTEKPLLDSVFNDPDKKNVKDIVAKGEKNLVTSIFSFSYNFF